MVVPYLSSTHKGVKTKESIEVRRSKLDNPHIKKEVVQRLAVGDRPKSIAKDVGLSSSQIYRFAKREDIKPFIEQEQIKLLEVVPDAVENVKELVREMKDIPKEEIKRRELSYKASLDTLKAVGIMPTPVQSQIITNIYQENNLIVSPAVQEIIRKHVRSLTFEGHKELEENREKGEETDG
jgi:hypothetical protein